MDSWYALFPAKSMSRPTTGLDFPTRTTSTLVQSLELMLQRIELVIVKLLELYEL